MTDEVVVVVPEAPAAEAAPEQVATAAPELEVKAPEKTEDKPAKTFTQEELDRIVEKRLAKEQRKFEREQSRLMQEAQQKVVAPPKLEEGDTVETYAEKLADQKAEQKAEELVKRREEQKRSSDIEESYFEREDAARSKYEDFQQVAYSDNHQVTMTMAEAIRESDLGPDIAYYLGTNPSESNRIAKLTPLSQAKEIGRIEAKLQAEPPKPVKTTSAPAPIKPVTAQAASQSYDTSDPRSVKTMSTSEWIAAERERQRKKYATR
jgi:hypothetical protein